MKGIDMYRISEKKRGLIKLVEQYGISHKKVILHSQELDLLINQWMEEQQKQKLSIEYVNYHYSLTHKI
ncbi:aspartyl-phosphate phosphatase Spo0E family protein [Bacillus cereus]|uniref:aspartyl-phosphate phosphatase Spo0E family protein n=1 Tax=Bacillus cereus TaxID=1396 RepID=UPI000BF81052|nr:hypothetical protein COL00_31490 [Bacillus cereus]PGQ05212.1 hypothetical protein COA09_27260 [Bacillus cereus]PGS41886.1 hypothetical protein COC67_32230 [Bacillus cereus]PGU93223.1 hypothetical protein COD77_28800 [Bacillus cereus]